MDDVIFYDGYTLDGELSRFVKVWLSVMASLCYCYVAGKIVPKGITRLFAFVPIVGLFLALPLNLHSMHLGGTSAFFIVWLANFKLLLFSFGAGPLSDPSLSLPQFIAVACFPIKIQQNHPPPKSEKERRPIQGTSKKGQKPAWNYAIKVLLLASLVPIYDYSDRMHPKLLLIVYCLHIYFMLELILAMVAGLVRILLGLELEAQFNEPYLSTSLQDFWGRRWNIMVSRILRPTVYSPTLQAVERLMGRKWASLPAVMGTFVVSALMHELIFFYLGRTRPTWVITWFFIFHGLCLAAEIGAKKAVSGRFKLPRAVATPMAVGFLMVTGFWWFLPELFRCNAVVRAFKEYALLGAFAKDVFERCGGFTFTLLGYETKNGTGHA